MVASSGQDLALKTLMQMNLDILNMHGEQKTKALEELAGEIGEIINANVPPEEATQVTPQAALEALTEFKSKQK